MKKYIKQKQVVAIYPNTYKILFTDPDPKTVLAYARTNRARLKKEGAIQVITNNGFYLIPV